jgi:fructose-1,6-bisphosphatase
MYAFNVVYYSLIISAAFLLCNIIIIHSCRSTIKYNNSVALLEEQGGLQLLKIKHTVEKYLKQNPNIKIEPDSDFII